MKAVYALFPDAESAQRAFESLSALGVPDRDIVVISSEPFEHYGFSQRDRASWIYWLAGAGGAAGAVVGYWLTRMTEQAWPLPTGGMPIVAAWPNLIIMFELTMLFAIVATVATLVVTTKLPRRQPSLYDRRVSDGRVLVGLENTSGVAVDRLGQALTSLGGELETIP